MSFPHHFGCYRGNPGNFRRTQAWVRTALAVSQLGEDGAGGTKDSCCNKNFCCLTEVPLKVNIFTPYSFLNMSE